MRRLLLFLTFALATGFVRGQDADRTLRLGDDFSRSTMQGYLALFSTPDRGLTLRDVSEARSAAVGFRPLTQEIPTLGMDNRYHWVRCRIQSVSRRPRELVFGLDFFEVNDLSFYVVDEAGRLLHRWERFSRNTPVAEKPVPTRMYAFPFVIQPNQRLTLYARVHRAESLVLLPVGLFSKATFYAAGFSYDVVMYFVLGIYLFLSLSSLLLYAFTRRRVLLLYAGYTVTTGLFFASLEGLFRQFFPFSIPFLDENANYVFAGLSLCCLLGFATEFLQTPTYAPAWLTKGTRGFLYAWLLVCGYVWVTPFQGSHASLIAVGNLLGLLLIVALILLGWGRGNDEVAIYLVAIAPFFSSMIWFALTVVFNLETTWLFYRFAYFAPFFEVCVLSVGVGYKLLHERERYFVGLNQLQRKFTDAIVETQETERQRVAADLHDDLGGTLAAVRFRLVNLRRDLAQPEADPAFARLEELVLKSIRDLRRISHNLMPPEFARIGLVSALQHLVGSIPPEPTRFTFITSGSPHPLPLETELSVYRIGSELIQNVLKHAQARRAAVQLLYHPDELLLLVEDDGLGSRVKKSDGQRAGIGLKTGSLRAEYIGATLRREASPSGTVAVLHLPYAPAPNAPPATA